ncbi:Anaphase-promoting protein [Helicobacter sp. NHP19-012]|uniref:Anaphase-promoting protein n=1 Tax=Helicobacter gastrofelis TaxID=2849642 RepID=A0ABM7SDM5_9HELI|nr:tetratricopeptide repeat protein [Helicobacter sp. NHP19-012]BCZ18512.1 Anaphase-promoting protein [Helicobacter sp. NHP19-012]
MVDENQEQPQKNKTTNRKNDPSDLVEGEQNKSKSKNKFSAFLDQIKKFFNKENSLFNAKSPKEFLVRLHSYPRLYFSVLGGTGLVVLIVVGALITSFVAHEEHHEKKLSKNTEQQLSKLVQVEKSENSILDNLPTLKESSRIPLSNEEQVNTLIKKAEILYNHGQIDESLQVFSNISNISSSIANHNLGVIRMRKHDYAGALQAFNDALAIKGNDSVDAIDAMAAAFYINNMDLYTRYLKVAVDNMSEIEKQPIYSYVYALTLYYGGHYFETLSALTNPNSDLFNGDRQRLAAKIYLLFGDEASAITQLSATATPRDNKALGLLYARMGDYEQAIEYLQRYNERYKEDKDVLVALELIALKLGDFGAVQDILKALLYDINKSKHQEKILTDTYPIEPSPNAYFFDMNTIRKDFWSRNFKDGPGLPIDRVLFYYAPYKLVNIKSALGAIQEGVFFVDSSGSQDFTGAVNFLENGKYGSLADRHMIAGIKHLSLFHLRLALKEFELSLEDNPNSSVAHYDTGLIYAQLENFHKARFHFKKAYHLDPKNVLAGIFAVMSTRLDYRDPSALLKQITLDFQTLKFSDPTRHAFLSSFLSYLNGATDDDLNWMQKAKRPLSIYYALGVAYANRTHNKQRLVKNFAALKKMRPKNMLTSVFYEMMLKYHADIRQMLGAYAFLTNKKTNFEELIHGPLLARKMYIYMGFITGLLNQEEEELNARLSASNNQEMSTDLLRMLGLLHIFQKQYEKSIGIYNALIDKLGDHEMEVYELASLSYIALKRFDDAALLLEIGKSMDPGNYDVRYGLGLLYQRVGNLEASLNNFGAIKAHDFHSSYFDFYLRAPTNAQDLP